MNCKPIDCPPPRKRRLNLRDCREVVIDCAPLSVLTDDYSARFADAFHNYSKLKSITDYICGKPNPDGTIIAPFKRASHQYCVSNNAITQAIKIFSQLESRNFKDFDELLAYIRQHAPKGFGLLSTYDFAVRSGWNRGNLLPEKYVYLHAGALEGARHLQNCGLIQLTHNAEKLSLEVFPKEIQKIGALHAENFLCIYKNALNILSITNNQKQ